MIHVLHKSEIPDHMWFNSNPIYREMRDWIWAVIMDGKIYQTWLYKHNAQEAAEDLVRYFS